MVRQQQVEFVLVPGERNLYYRHDEYGRPIPTEDVAKAFEFKDSPAAWKAETMVTQAIRVSTVFLALDHGYIGEPILWETMVFGGVLDQEQERYSCLAAAKAGHVDMVTRVKKMEGL